MYTGVNGSFRILSFLFVLVFSGSLMYSQENVAPKSGTKVGITFASFGDNPAIPFAMLCGSASYSGEGFYTLGITYARPISKRIDFETGFAYSRHSLMVHPNLPPDMDNTPYETSLDLFTVPFTARLTLGRIFFLNGGGMLNVDTGLSDPVDSQSGISAMIGFGFAYEFISGLSIYINAQKVEDVSLIIGVLEGRKDYVLVLYVEYQNSQTKLVHPVSLDSQKIRKRIKYIIRTNI